MSQNFLGVVAKHFHVAEILLDDAVQKFTHTRLMHFYTEKVDLWVCRRHL